MGQVVGAGFNSIPEEVQEIEEHKKEIRKAKRRHEIAMSDQIQEVNEICKYILRGKR